MQPYNILCATDDNYVLYCGIMLTSLFENNQEDDIDVYLLTEGISKENNETLQMLANKYGKNIIPILVDNEILGKCPIRIGDHVSIATYYRLLAPYLLPKNIEKILYIDCDIIINGNLSSLYEINIEDHPAAMCKDEAFFIDEKYERLDYSKEYSYKNAGVALLNIQYWRENDLADKCLEYISKYPERVKFHDQDTLNALLHKDIISLPIKYNLQTGFLLTDYTKNYKNEFDEIIEAAKSPVIIHFTGVNKPWYKGSRHPFCNRFMHYRNISYWHSHPLKQHKQSLYDRIIGLRNNIIWSLGIKRKPQSYIIEQQP